MPRRKNKSARSAHGIRIIYQDEQIVVVDKPAGLTTVRHRGEVADMGPRALRFLPPTLVDLLPQLVQGRGRIRAVHRLDRDTTGLVVLARTDRAESHLGKQFRAHSIERRYLALVRGQAQPQRIESWLVPDRGDGRRGSGARAQGQKAVTAVRVLEQLKDFSLVECQLETGRTHQVRIHLGESGTPLCGEKVYDRPLRGLPGPDLSGASRPMLHAAVLAIDHPVTGQRLRWHAALPADMTTLLALLRVSRSPPPGNEVASRPKPKKTRPRPGRWRKDQPPGAGQSPGSRK